MGRGGSSVVCMVCKFSVLALWVGSGFIRREATSVLFMIVAVLNEDNILMLNTLSS